MHFVEAVVHQEWKLGPRHQNGRHAVCLQDGDRARPTRFGRLGGLAADFGLGSASSCDLEGPPKFMILHNGLQRTAKRRVRRDSAQLA